ncbi:MAG: cytochrome c [Acidimicrobiia bacterium]|nr:cytochrome c [Acidimicrobiia bacterium]
MSRRSLLGLLAALIVAACAGPPPTLGDADLDAGRDTYGRLCATCHGGSGEGGFGAPLNSVVATFPDCETHIQWITLGSEGWKTEVGPTYGADEKDITAIMPSWQASLSEDQIRQVAAFERFRFGGSNQQEALAGCGLG